MRAWCKLSIHRVPHDATKQLYRLGTRKWDGLPLYSSYRAFIGNREVELDSEITRSELPAIVGTSKELPVDPEYNNPPLSQTRPSFLVDAIGQRRVSQENGGSSSPVAASSPASAKKFISPASFYGTSVKPKPKGPLYVFCRRIYPPTHFVMQVTTRMPQALW